MIEICAEDPVISIIPLNEHSLRDAAMLYNSGSDIRYATGVEGFVPASVVKSRLGFSESDSNFFAAAIYMNNDPESACETGGNFAGVITGTVCGSSIWIMQLSIMPAHRRKGLGSRAVKLVYKYLEQKYQASEVFVSVVSENEPGLRFWKKLGFNETGRIEKYLFGSRRKYSIIIMKKTPDPELSHKI